ncbi:MAG: DUF1538 domain-containing protein [Anaeroplasmataceae bacterium]|nr:DUF1538 domain-containing protein [Anaeroplasmataceae bacterium]
MLKLLWIKIKEALMSVLPVTLIVMILFFTPLVNLTNYELIVFFVSAFLLILGIGLFNLGADLAMQPMGEQVGSSLMKSKKIKIIVLVCFVMGLLITIAEPDLSVLASQVKEVIHPTLLIFSVGIGVGLFLVLAILKIIFKKDLSLMLMFFYMLMFALAGLVILNGNGNFLALGFDSGGVTTGPITVPFIMALGVGVAATIGGRNSSENSFGLIALCSVGPILAVFLLGIAMKGDIPYTDPNYEVNPNFWGGFFQTLGSVSKEVITALGLIVGFFLIIELIFIKLPKKKLIQIGIGIAYTFIGLVIFLTAVNIGFLPIGYKMGKAIAAFHPAYLIVFGFVLGFVVVLAEPAVHVLNKQVEEVTNGGVTKRAMLIALAIGVGISIGLSMIRLTFDFSILYYIIPGYFISLGLSFFVPRMYTAIAFDSGGVASGPLTSSFILPFAIGACITLYDGPSKVLNDAFGIVAMVAMTPLITIQLLGFKAIFVKRVKEKTRLKKIIDADDEQIINFM